MFAFSEKLKLPMWALGASTSLLHLNPSICAECWPTTHASDHLESQVDREEMVMLSSMRRKKHKGKPERVQGKEHRKQSTNRA